VSNIKSLKTRNMKELDNAKFDHQDQFIPTDLTTLQ